MPRIRQVRARAAKDKVEARKAYSWVLKITKSHMFPAVLSTLLLFQLLENCIHGVSISKASWDSATMKIEVGLRWSRTCRQVSWKLDKLMRQWTVCRTHRKGRSQEKLVMELEARRQESFHRRKQSRKVGLRERGVYSTQRKSRANQWTWQVARTISEVMVAKDPLVYQRTTTKYWGSSTRWPRSFWTMNKQQTFTCSKQKKKSSKWNAAQSTQWWGQTTTESSPVAMVPLMHSAMAQKRQARASNKYNTSMVSKAKECNWLVWA